MVVKINSTLFENIRSVLQDCKNNTHTYRDSIIEITNSIESKNLNLPKEQTLKNRMVITANDIVHFNKANVAIRKSLKLIMDISKKVDSEVCELLNAFKCSNKVSVKESPAKCANTDENAGVSKKFIRTIKLKNGDYIGLTPREAAIYETIKANGGSPKDLWSALGYTSYEDFVKDYGITEEEANKIDEEAKTNQTSSNGGTSNYKTASGKINVVVDADAGISLNVTYGNQSYRRVSDAEYANLSAEERRTAISDTQFNKMVGVMVHEQRVNTDEYLCFSNVFTNVMESGYNIESWMDDNCAKWTSDDIYNYANQSKYDQQRQAAEAALTDVLNGKRVFSSNDVTHWQGCLGRYDASLSGYNAFGKDVGASGRDHMQFQSGAI